MTDKLEERMVKIEQAVVAVQDKMDKVARISARATLDSIGAVVAIVAIVVLEVYAIHKGVNGTFFLPVVAVVAALGGVKANEIIEGIFGRRKK